ncbi:hypothetical protein T440DRAFT_51348 [Plenodomus tracheiphilus IPT5]|uniref:Secreted protein n=1 Tax=Plenodomus tracheiphilus IPT5 TaxID=1408161 RepID=A0A6A7B9Q4_9PLEO|nr:hypothetical protein T440DRAFT_51348 [Plenodomus tracheiphilus IPT5]
MGTSRRVECVPMGNTVPTYLLLTTLLLLCSTAPPASPFYPPSSSSGADIESGFPHCRRLDHPRLESVCSAGQC